MEHSSKTPLDKDAAGADATTPLIATAGNIASAVGNAAVKISERFCVILEEGASGVRWLVFCGCVAVLVHQSLCTIFSPLDFRANLLRVDAIAVGFATMCVVASPNVAESCGCIGSYQSKALIRFKFLTVPLGQVAVYFFQACLLYFAGGFVTKAVALYFVLLCPLGAFVHPGAAVQQEAAAQPEHTNGVEIGPVELSVLPEPSVEEVGIFIDEGQIDHMEVPARIALRRDPESELQSPFA